jgi:hypothetical protein
MERSFKRIGTMIPTFVAGLVVAAVVWTPTAAGASTRPAHTDNSPPSILAAVIVGAPFTNSTFTAEGHKVKDPDGDAVTLHYAWTMNGSPAGGDTLTYSAANLQAGDVVDLSITPRDSSGNWGAAVQANAPVTLKWELDAPASRPTESSHPFDMNNFSPGEVVQIRMDSPTGRLIDSITANVNGNAFNQVVPIPWPMVGGPHVLYGVGMSSGIIGHGPIDISAIAFDGPGSLHVGWVTTVSGSGFIPGETVTAAFPGHAATPKVADPTGTILIDLTMPEMAFPGGDIAVDAPSGNLAVPFKVISDMTFDATVGEPHDNMGFNLHGYGPNETVEARIDGVLHQTYTTNADGSLRDTLFMDATFGSHRILMTGLDSAQQHNWKISLLPYMTVTPAPAHPGDTLTITSLYGWVPINDTVYLYWGKNVVQVLHPDSAGSVATTFQVPLTQKAGNVTLKLLDTKLGKYAKRTIMINI